MELYAAFEQSVSSTSRILGGVRAADMTAPTPCPDWDVRALLNHLIGTLWLSADLFSDQAPRYPAVPGGLPGTDLGRQP